MLELCLIHLKTHTFSQKNKCSSNLQNYICPIKLKFTSHNYPNDETKTGTLDLHGLRVAWRSYCSVRLNMYSSWLVNWGFTSHQQLRSYGDGTSVYSPIRRTGEARDRLNIYSSVMSICMLCYITTHGHFFILTYQLVD